MFLKQYFLECSYYPLLTEVSVFVVVAVVVACRKLPSELVGSTVKKTDAALSLNSVKGYKFRRDDCLHVVIMTDFLHCLPQIR